MPDIEVVDHPEASRYEACVGDGVAVLEYQLKPGEIVLAHTEVPDAAEGHGIGQALVRHALDDARARGKKVVPSCPFVLAWIAGHPEYKDLVRS